MARRVANTFVTLIIIGLLASLTPTATAKRPPPVPQEQWTKETTVWLARAWVAEAGWPKTYVKKEEQHAIGYALAARWKQLLKRYPRIRFVSVIRAYCAGLGENLRKEPTSRQKWIRNLLGPNEPKGWPRSFVSWERHRPLWKDTIDRVRLFSQGRISNPCPGASFFGGKKAGDVPKGKMVRHDCSDRFENQDVPGTTFYVLDV